MRIRRRIAVLMVALDTRRKYRDIPAPDLSAQLRSLRRVLDERRDGKATVFRYQDQIGCRLDCIWELKILDCHSRILHFTLITALILDPQSPIWAISLWNPSTQIGTQTTTSPNRKGQNGRFSKVRLWTPHGPVQFAQSPLALVPVVDIHMFSHRR